MAITFDAALGNFAVTQEAAGAGSAVITTSAVAAAGSRIVVCVSWFDSGGAAFTVSDSGGSYTKDKQGDNGSDHFAIFSRVLVGSLASSSAITISWTSAFGSGGVGAAACSYLGTTAFDTTANNNTSGTGFSSGSATNAVADALFVGGAGIDGPATTSVGGTNTNGTMRFDFWTGGGVNQGMRMLDSIASSKGAQALTGTWNSSGTTTGALVVYSGTPVAVAPFPFLPRNTLLRGVRNRGQIARFIERIPQIPVIVIPDVPPIWPPPQTFPATRNRSFFIVRGHQRQPVPTQEMPIAPARALTLRKAFAPVPHGRRSLPALPQFNPPYPWPNRVDPGRSKIAALGRGKRWLQPLPQFNPPYPWPTRTSSQSRRLFALDPRGRRWLPTPAQSDVWPVRVSGTRRELFVLARRGQRPFPVQPQIAVPPMIPPKLGAPRRLLNSTARGHQWSAAYMVATAAPVLSWPPPRMGAPRRLLGTVTRGRPASPPWPQAAPVSKLGAPRRPQAPPGRGRRTGPPLPQRNPPYPWPPRSSSARSKASMLRRGRCVNVVPAQVTVPPIVITRTATRWRWLTVRRGRPGNPVLTQTQIVAPNPPCITDPTTVAVVVYLSHAVITPYISAVKGINPYTSTSQIAAYTSAGHIVAYTAAPAIASPTSDVAVVSYSSDTTIGPRFCP